MPYAKQEHRDTVDHHINKLLDELQRHSPEDRGGLFDYIVFRILSFLCHGQKYHVQRGYVGDIVWALLEWFRRRAAPYEDKKITENGDVW